MTELSPQVLESIGLAAGIEWLANEAFAGQIECTIRDECDAGGLSEEANLLLFHSVRETLQNTVKHAQVPTADIAWSCVDGSFVLEVRDEGVGFDPKAVRRASDRFGLLSLRVRAEHLGGVLIIDSAAGKGTLVRSSCPWSQTSSRPCDSGFARLPGRGRRLRPVRRLPGPAAGGTVDPPPSRALCDIHRAICEADELVGSRRFSACARHAKGGREGDNTVCYLEGQSEFVRNRPGHHFGIVYIAHDRQYHRELVSAEAGDGVFSADVRR